MFRAAVRTADDDGRAATLFADIGRLLDDLHLSPDPANYAFAHQILTDPDGPLARAYAELARTGGQLNQTDIATLAGADRAGADLGAVGEDTGAGARLADRTEHQLRDFAALMARMQTETSDFGRDLAASVSALPDAEDSVALIAAAMLGRVRDAEERLEKATSEADALREELEAARGDARSDALTGLPNRRALMEEFAEHSAAAVPQCLAVCDIDRFKRINDRFGHRVGDRVLRAVAGALAEACGAAFVARYGGEEFAVLFAAQSLEQATATLDRARAAVAAKRYRTRDEGTPLGAITFSAGIVTVMADEAFDIAFERADKLLYVAKHKGRNQVRT